MRVEQNPILEIPERVFKDKLSSPEQVPNILGWIERNGVGFEELLIGFDQVIDDFNSRAVADYSYSNFYLVKNILGGQNLPTTHEILSENGRNSARLYLGTVRGMRRMMLRGQAPIEERVEPWMAYHTTKTDLKTLVIASIFHAYEELIKNRPEFSDKSFEHDRITEALMEVASEHKDSGLFDALARKDGMNWVDGYDRFSPEFRHKNDYN